MSLYSLCLVKVAKTAICKFFHYPFSTQATEEMHRHHEEVVSNLKKSKIAELDAALATHDNAQNLNAFVTKLSNNTSDLTSLAAKVEAVSR